jgi:magnesium-transporting ATPase (P-type)
VIDYVVKAFAQKAFRTIMFATKTMTKRGYEDMCREFARAKGKDISELDEFEKGELLEQGLTVIGVMCLIDPLRDGVTGAVTTCGKAGVKVIMCTGDIRDTACAISVNAGIIVEGE